MKILLLFDPTQQGTGGTIRVTRLRRAVMRLGFQPLCLSLDRTDSFVRTLSAMPAPDLVFSSVTSLKVSPRRALDIHQTLEHLGIPYVGSPPEVLKLALSKVALKEKWQRENLSTPQFWAVDRQTDMKSLLETMSDGDLPLIVKPSAEGNSRGISEDSVVSDRSQLRAVIQESLKSFQSVILEQYLGHIEGVREFTVAMVGNGTGALIMPAELILHRQGQHRLITTKDKEQGSVEAIAISDPELHQQLCEFASQAFQIAGVCDYARCDLLMAGDHLFALEINGQPMVPDPWFEACCRGAGLTETQYLGCILLASIHRQRERLPAPLILHDLHHSLPPGLYDRFVQLPLR